MSTEETITNQGEAEQKDSPRSVSTETRTTQSSVTKTVAEGSATAVASQREDEEETRPAGEDFGQLLDQFEQEQSTLQEVEVVRGSVVGITERGVVNDFGYKSEGIVNPNEVMEDETMTVK